MSQRTFKVLSAVPAAVIALFVAAGCSTPDRSIDEDSSGQSIVTEDAAEPTTEPEPTTARMPNLVGRGLQAAQDAAQDAGFYNLSSHDLTGAERNQVFDRNWQVCTQTPGPGEISTDAPVDFGVVKLEESCAGLG